MTAPAIPLSPSRDGYRLQALSLIPGALFLTVFVIRSGLHAEGPTRFTLFDDSMVSMAYGRTLAETGEWVWFPGADRVQGISNPLWSLYMAGLHAAGLEGSLAALAVSVTGIVVVLASGLLVARVVRLGLGDWRWSSAVSAIAGGTVPFIYPLAFWSLRGMEVGLLALLAMVMILGLALVLTGWDAGGHARTPLVVVTVAGALGIATRIDFVLIAGSICLLALFWAPAGRSRALVVTVVGLPLLLVTIMLLAFQQGYWGDWLPNTFRLKMEGVDLLDRLARGAASGGKSLALAVLAAAGFAAALRYSPSRRTRRVAGGLAAIVIVTSAYSLWVGGDAWEWSLMLNRYISVGLPAAVALVFLGGGLFLAARPATGPRSLLLSLVVLTVAGLGIGVGTNPLQFSWLKAAPATAVLAFASLLLWLATRCYWQAPQSAPRAVAAGLALSFALVAATSALPGMLWIRDGGAHVRDDARMTSLAVSVARVTDDRALIATVWAGAPGYYARRPMVDLLGKSDRTIAARPPSVDGNTGRPHEFLPGHNKWDYGYSIGQLSPDVVLQLWHGLDPTILRDWGYVRRCLPDGTELYVRQGSDSVHWDVLASCPADTPSP